MSKVWPWDNLAEAESAQEKWNIAIRNIGILDEDIEAVEAWMKLSSTYKGIQGFIRVEFLSPSLNPVAVKMKISDHPWYLNQLAALAKEKLVKERAGWWDDIQKIKHKIFTEAVR